MKTKTSVSLSDLTRSQINELAESLGINQTEVISLAVDRMYQKESTMTYELYGFTFPNNVHPDEAVKMIAVLDKLPSPTRKKFVVYSGRQYADNIVQNIDELRTLMENS